MKVAAEHNQRIAKMLFASVYPHYITKVERKGRTKEELHQVIEWLTGFDEKNYNFLLPKKQLLKPFLNKRTSIPRPTSLPDSSAATALKNWIMRLPEKQGIWINW